MSTLVCFLTIRATTVRLLLYSVSYIGGQCRRQRGRSIHTGIVDTAYGALLGDIFQLAFNTPFFKGLFNAKIDDFLREKKFVINDFLVYFCEF